MSLANTSTMTTTITTPVIVPEGSVAKRFPTTEAQLEIWLSNSQSIEASCAYNEISTLELRGSLDRQVLAQAIEKVIQRHECLRATFSVDGSEVLVSNEAVFGYEFVDWSADSNVDFAEKRRDVVQREACTPFDLENGPLIRFVLQRMDGQTHFLTFAAHHIILDGWSLAVFCRDLGLIYDQILSGADENLPPANLYENYSSAMLDYFSSEQGQADEQFWVNQFEDQIPVLDLPTERSRPKLRTYFGRRFDHQVSAELVSQLKRIGSKSGCSLFNTFLAAFQAWVARLSNSSDFCVGIPTAGQAAMDHPDLVGHCVNTMPLRCQIDEEQSFNDLVKATRTSLLDAFEHQRYSFGQLLRKLAPPRDPSRPPMLAISFNLDPTIDTTDIGFSGLNVDVKIEPRSFENFEWFVNGVINKDQSVELQIQYNTDLFSAQSMAFYFEGFEAFLQGIASRPDDSISSLPMMSIDQRKQVLVDWNQTKFEFPETSSVHQEFARQASETPDAIAVTFGNNSLSYAEVDRRSNQIARYLIDHGVTAGQLVGICVERNEQMLVALYGILKAGAGYVPLDPAYPSDRLQYMCDHSELNLVVTQSDLTDRVAGFGKQALALDTECSAIQALADGPLDSRTEPYDTCYVIYTSGSTGKPKGVQVPHGTVVNFLYSMRRSPGFSPNDSVLAVTTLSFDIAVLELYLPTLFGGTVVIVDGETTTDGNRLAEALVEHDISLLQATPATWRLMIQSGWQGKDDLKVLCGGEPMPADLVGPLLERCNELWNMYGPTETTVWSAAYQITSATAPILIGQPVGNTQIYILDAKGREVPVGCEGEVFIGGAGVTHGYLHRDDLTQDRFVDNPYFNPFENYINHRLYKTGDLARYCFDGNIQFLRRNDKQVKVRGFRIELGEIEQALKSQSAVQQCVAIVREDTVGDARLVGYVVPEKGESVDPNSLKNDLRQSLPYYMVPQHVVVMQQLPQTNNGKIDYQALPAPESTCSGDANGSQPISISEKFLAQVWQDALETDEDVFLQDNFFDIGGHSLLVMKVIKKVEEEKSVRLSPQEFLMATLEQMAAVLDAEDAEKGNDESLESTLPTSSADEDSIEHEVATEPIVSAAEAKSEHDVDQQPNGILKKLKGFWE